MKNLKILRILCAVAFSVHNIIYLFYKNNIFQHKTLKMQLHIIFSIFLNFSLLVILLYINTFLKFYKNCISLSYFHRSVTSNLGNLLTWRQLFRAMFRPFSIQIGSHPIIWWESFLIVFYKNSTKKPHSHIQLIMGFFPSMLQHIWKKTTCIFPRQAKWNVIRYQRRKQSNM